MTRLVRIWGLRIISLIRERVGKGHKGCLNRGICGEKGHMEKRMTFRKNIWVLRRIEGRYDHFVTKSV